MPPEKKELISDREGKRVENLSLPPSRSKGEGRRHRFQQLSSEKKKGKIVKGKEYVKKKKKRKRSLLLIN